MLSCPRCIVLVLLRAMACRPSTGDPAIIRPRSTEKKMHDARGFERHEVRRRACRSLAMPPPGCAPRAARSQSPSLVAPLQLAAPARRSLVIQAPAGPAPAAAAPRATRAAARLRLPALRTGAARQTRAWFRAPEWSAVRRVLARPWRRRWLYLRSRRIAHHPARGQSTLRRRPGVDLLPRLRVRSHDRSMPCALPPASTERGPRAKSSRRPAQTSILHGYGRVRGARARYRLCDCQTQSRASLRATEVELALGPIGNFMTRFDEPPVLVFPIRAKTVHRGRERVMSTAQSSGDCNACHTERGRQGAPGRIHLP